MKICIIGMTSPDVHALVCAEIEQRLAGGPIPFVTFGDIDRILDKDPDGSQIVHFIDDLVELWTPMVGAPTDGEELCPTNSNPPTGLPTEYVFRTEHQSLAERYRPISPRRRSRFSRSEKPT